MHLRACILVKHICKVPKEAAPITRQMIEAKKKITEVRRNLDQSATKVKGVFA